MSAEPASYVDPARIEQLRRSCADRDGLDYLLTKLYFLQSLNAMRVKTLGEYQKTAARHAEQLEKEAAAARAERNAVIDARLERREQGIAIAGVVECIHRWRVEAKIQDRAAALEPDIAGEYQSAAGALRRAANEASLVLRKGQFPAEIRPPTSPPPNGKVKRSTVRASPGLLRASR